MITQEAAWRILTWTGPLTHWIEIATFYQTQVKKDRFHPTDMTYQEQRLVYHLIQELEGSHSSYLDGLKSDYPGLTPYELRLCAYMRSNLTNKEIALILNIQPESVKKAKQRLRKKLTVGLPDD